MHYSTTLAQALATFDRLTDEHQQLREDIQDTTPGRLQELALDALESELSTTISAVTYRRRDERDKAEKAAQEKLDDEQRDQEEATRERLRSLTTQPTDERAQVELAHDHANAEQRRLDATAAGYDHGTRGLDADDDLPALLCQRHISLNDARPCQLRAGHQGPHASLADDLHA